MDIDRNKIPRNIEEALVRKGFENNAIIGKSDFSDVLGVMSKNNFKGDINIVKQGTDNALVYFCPTGTCFYGGHLPDYAIEDIENYHEGRTRVTFKFLKNKSWREFK